MARRVDRWLGALVACVAVVAMPGTAHARTAQLHPAVSPFVGTYNVQVEYTGAERFGYGGNVTLNADGTVSKQHSVGTWSTTGRTVTIEYTYRKVSFVMVGNRTGTGVGSKKRPGTFTRADQPAGLWYATKVSPQLAYRRAATRMQPKAAAREGVTA